MESGQRHEASDVNLLTMERELTLNKSYGEFVLGAPVFGYLENREYEKRIYHERTYENECYVFEEGWNCGAKEASSAR